jgi:hypothetical protein
MDETITAIDTIALRIPLDIWAPAPMSQGVPRTHVESLYVRVAAWWAGVSHSAQPVRWSSRRSTTGSGVSPLDRAPLMSNSFHA